MARVHLGNLNSRVPDPRPMLNPVDEPPRNHDFDKKARDAAIPRGGAGGRASAGSGGGRAGGRGGRGGRVSDQVRCCYGCGEPGHLARDCPTVTPYARSYARRGNQANVNDPLKSEAAEVSSVNPKFRAKPLNASAEVFLNLEPAKPLSDELSSKNVYINSLLAKLGQKENELEGMEIKLVNDRLNEATSEIVSVQAKNEEMILNVNKLEDDLEKCREDLSSARNKEEEMTWNWCCMQDEFEETKAHLKEKSKELEEANETANAEMTKLKLEIEQWRKTAKAVAEVLTGGVETCSKTPELEALVLYYSNRAAKRLSLGKIRKALDDCRMAARLDPNFLKVRVTAANCHLALGELDDALKNYRKCLESGTVCLDRRLTIEAFDGQQNAQKVVNYINWSTELLQKKTFESARTALESITEALLISCYSEKLLEMKGEALFMLQKYEEVVQMCDHTLAFAEKNCVKIIDSNHVSDEQNKPLKVWRWNLMSRSYFHMAKLEMALVILEKKEQLTSTETRTEGPSFPSAATVRELLHCKSAGNEAYQAGRHRDALEHYSNAILQSTVSWSFSAVCLCNRAAAHQALGEVVDAIADCNLAIALNGNYVKAISRRANLHEKIRDYEHASLDLQRLISLLEKRCVEKEVEDLKVARSRLSSIDRNMKKGMTMDLYLILGLKGSESGSEIKKAYHKAALRHHPDKAGKFLARSESEGDGHIWKEIFTTVHKDADRLFKIIGEAYAVLSDANKRFKYNLEGAMNDDFGW